MQEKLYKFANPENEEESKFLFILIEDRDTRAVYHCIGSLKDGILPTFVYNKSDMIEN